MPRRRAPSSERDAVAACADHARPEEAIRREATGEHDAVSALPPTRRRECQGAVRTRKTAQLALLANLDAVSAQAVGKPGGELLRPDEPVDTRVKSSDHAAGVERRL